MHVATLELQTIRSLRKRLIEVASERAALGARVNADLAAKEVQMLAGSPGPAGADPAVLARAFVQAMPSLATFERYERRAWSRRKMALRRMEAAG